MNRRGFFAAILAPLVVPWKRPCVCGNPSCPLGWKKKRKIEIKTLRQLNHQMDAIYNAMIDNIPLSRG